MADLIVVGYEDDGVDDNFMRELGSALETGTSAIFVLVRQATPDKVLEEVSKFGGKVLRTSLLQRSRSPVTASSLGQGCYSLSRYKFGMSIYY